MNNQPFRFKQFLIHHDQCAMKVGTDGVLLGAWTDLENSQTILDIGTGSGLIAIMAAQRNGSAIIDAVEIDIRSYQQAHENIAISKWKERINVYNSSIQDYYPGKWYDTILTNPPFFSNGIAPENPVRGMARNSLFLSQKDLFEAVNRLLKPAGSFSLIYPIKEGMEMIKLSGEYGLHLASKMILSSRHSMKPERLLLKFTRTRSIPLNSELVIYESGKDQKQYTQEYVSLTKDFYLYN